MRLFSVPHGHSVSGVQGSCVMFRVWELSTSSFDRCHQAFVILTRSEVFTNPCECYSFFSPSINLIYVFDFKENRTPNFHFSYCGKQGSGSSGGALTWQRNLRVTWSPVPPPVLFYSPKWSCWQDTRTLSRMRVDMISNLPCCSRKE